MRPDGPRDPIVGPDSGPAPPFPLKLNGEVVKGFGRGSKEVSTTFSHTFTKCVPFKSISSTTKQKDRRTKCGNNQQEILTSHPPQLGIPTANIPLTGLTVGGHDTIESGVYYGYCSLSSTNKVYPQVMSIGWNPFYKNTVRSVEVHVLEKFDKDFYGAHMNLVILGFIRPEYDYVSKESLIEDIEFDVEVARRSLEREGYVRFKEDGYLMEFEGRSGVAS
jgi:riboflavin kinase